MTGIRIGAHMREHDHNHLAWEGRHPVTLPIALVPASISSSDLMLANVFIDHGVSSWSSYPSDIFVRSRNLALGASFGCAFERPLHTTFRELAIGFVELGN